VPIIRGEQAFLICDHGRVLRAMERPEFSHKRAHCHPSSRECAPFIAIGRQQRPHFARQDGGRGRLITGVFPRSGAVGELSERS